MNLVKLSQRKMIKFFAIELEGTLTVFLLTLAKKTDEKRWLADVSSIPLQQSLRDLSQGFKNFFDSCKGKRKGAKIKPPRFKKRKSKQSAKFTNNGFKINQHNVDLAKIGKLKIVWSRKLPSKSSSVIVIKDSADRYFLSFVCEVTSQILLNPTVNDGVLSNSD